jgi:hypothetical protein
MTASGLALGNDLYFCYSVSGSGVQPLEFPQIDLPAKVTLAMTCFTSLSVRQFEL